MPCTDPDRIWRNFHFSHRTVRIDFFKILQKALSIYPDKNQANQTNPYLVPDKNLPKVGIEPTFSAIISLEDKDRELFKVIMDKI